MPREIDAILDDADDESIPTWKRVGGFDVLESPLGTAVLCGQGTGHAHALIRYADKVCMEIIGGTYDQIKGSIPAALRERPVPVQTLDLDDEEKEEAPVEEVSPVPAPERPKPAPRQWRVVPITAGDDE